MEHKNGTKQRSGLKAESMGGKGFMDVSIGSES